MLEVPPDPADEFSLLDETALLFRMLLAGGPEACQATNLLRALRQNKGAAALGLLETHEQRSGENSDIEVTLSTRGPSCAPLQLCSGGWLRLWPLDAFARFPTLPRPIADRLGPMTTLEQCYGENSDSESHRAMAAYSCRLRALYCTSTAVHACCN